MALPQLMLCPLRDSYNLTFGDDVITVQYSDGMPRQRLGSSGRPHHTPISFINTKAKQDYLQAFWRVNRANAFALRLLGDSTTLEWYECRFIAPPQLRALAPNIFEWSCEIVVKPQPINVVLDADIITIFELSGGKPDEFYNYLELLVNQDLPKAMQSVESIKTAIDYNEIDLTRTVDTMDFVSMSGGDQQRASDGFTKLTNEDLLKAMQGW
jgi:hypothetical protein